MIAKAAIAALALISGVLFFPSCTRSNNLLLGRVEATAGAHAVVVTDCYRFTVDPPRVTTDSLGTTWSFAPCRDARVLIRNGTLEVNGKSYGPLGSKDSILVDHGVVSIRHKPSS